LVPAPTWSAIEAALSRELEHLERHVEEGDDDPVEATYAICYGSRILYAIETGDVAISKRAGGMWALEHVDAGHRIGDLLRCRSFRAWNLFQLVWIHVFPSAHRWSPIPGFVGSNPTYL
jgi:hypothetical protein